MDAPADVAVTATANWRPGPPGRESRFTLQHCPNGPPRHPPERRLGTTGFSSGKGPQPNPTGEPDRRSPAGIHRVVSHPQPNTFRSGLTSSAAQAVHPLHNRCIAGASPAAEVALTQRWLASQREAPGGESGRIPSHEPRAMFATGGECRVHVVRQRAPRRAPTVATSRAPCKRPLAFPWWRPNHSCRHIAVAAVRTKRYPDPPAIGGSDSTRTLRNPKRGAHLRC